MFNKLLVAAAVALCAPAWAGPVYATSGLKVQDMSLTGATITGYSANLNNSASMNSAPVSSGAACNSLGAPPCGSPIFLDATVVNALGSTAVRTENTFGFLGSNSVDSYSNADSIATAPSAFQQVAESLLNIAGFAAANSLVQGNTKIVTEIKKYDKAAAIDFSFLADVDQASTGSGSYLSQSDINTSFTLNGAGGSIGWTPNGTTGTNDCVVLGFVGVTCTEVFDTADLNNNASSSFNSFDVPVSYTAFAVRITGLEAGDYTTTLNANTSTSIVNKVPEPATLALAGIALLGLGLTRRKV